MATIITLFLTFFSLCIAIPLAKHDPTDGRFNYRCLQNSTIVSYDASEFEEVSFGVWRSYPKCSKFIGANEKAQWEINFDECAAPGTRQIDIILESYRPGDMDSLVYSLSVDCDIQGR